MKGRDFSGLEFHQPRISWDRKLHHENQVLWSHLARAARLPTAFLPLPPRSSSACSVLTNNIRAVTEVTLLGSVIDDGPDCSAHAIVSVEDLFGAVSDHGRSVIQDVHTSSAIFSWTGAIRSSSGIAASSLRWAGGHPACARVQTHFIRR
jgi:hypothetical protein